MLQIVLQVFLGWPAMILSLVLALAGILLRKPVLSLASAILFLAPAWYLSHYSIFLGSLPFFLLLSAQAISRNRLVLAFAAIIPVLFIMGSLGYAVLAQ